MKFQPIAQFSSLSQFDRNRSNMVYETFCMNCVRVFDQKLYRFFSREYRIQEKENVCNSINFYIRKIVESINNEKENILYIWLDEYIIIDKFDVDRYYEDDYEVENCIENVISNNIRRRITEYIDTSGKMYDDIVNNELSLIFCNYAIIPKKIPISILNYKL